MQPSLRHAALAEAETLLQLLTNDGTGSDAGHGKSTSRMRSANPAVSESRQQRVATRAASALPKACLGCSEILPHGERTYCDACVPWKQAENRTSRYTAGQEALAKARAEGKDPGHGDEAGKARGRKNAGHDAANRAWDAEDHPELEGIEFERDILPGIRPIPLLRLVAITGLSLRYCSLIRRGEMVPHPRHWRVLVTLEAVDNRAAPATMRMCDRPPVRRVQPDSSRHRV